MDQLELKYNASNEILGRVLGFKAELESRRELKVRSPPYGAPAHQVGADRGAMEVGQGTRAGLVPVGAIPRGPPADAQWGRPVDSAEYASRQPAKAMDPAAREAVVRERIQFLEAEMEQLVQAHGKLREQWEDRFKQLSPAFAEQQAQRARQLVAQSPRPEPLSSSDLQRSHPVGELPRKVQFKPDVTLAKEHSPFPGKLIAAGAVTAIGVAILGAGLNQAVKQSLLLTDAHTPEEQLQESFRELEWQWMLLKGQEAAEKDMQK